MDSGCGCGVRIAESRMRWLRVMETLLKRVVNAQRRGLRRSHQDLAYDTAQIERDFCLISGVFNRTCKRVYLKSYKTKLTESFRPALQSLYGLSKVSFFIQGCVVVPTADLGTKFLLSHKTQDEMRRGGYRQWRQMSSVSEWKSRVRVRRIDAREEEQ